MKKLLSSLALSTVLAVPAIAEEQRNLVTILTAPEPQTQLMAMVLTLNAVQQGASTKVLLCGPAGDIALKDAPASATTGQPPRDASPQGLMRMMMDQHNVKVEVCAIYLPGKGADASVLLDGVTAAAPDAMARDIMADNTVVMSF
jgi:hypothetical protein